jgi:hypothetical protein
LDSLNDHVARLSSLGFGPNLISEFDKSWKRFEGDGYEVYGMYTGPAGSLLEGKAACIICSKSSSKLRWHEVTTPSMDSAAIYSVCDSCDSIYIEAALRQKALGRLLRERNTRPT